MKQNKALSTFYWVFWFSVTIATGILSGFLVSHSIMLGRFFTWLVESGHEQFFVEYFSKFRTATHANVHYNIMLYVGLFSGILWIITCFLSRKSRIVSITAGFSTFWVGSVFFATEFSSIEDAVSTGSADAATLQSFITMNLPLHITFAVIYTLSFTVLLWTGFKQRKDEDYERNNTTRSKTFFGKLSIT